jgi:AraC-like DNA-binding protein
VWDKSAIWAGTVENQTNQWATSAVAEAKSIGYWNQLLSEKVIGLDIQSDVTHGFNGRLIGTSMGQQYAYLIAAGHNQRASHRIRSAGASRTGEVYVLIHMRSGEFELETSSHDALLRQGDSVLLSATEAFKFSCPENTSSLVLRFDHRWLKKWIPLANDCIGQRIDGTCGWGQTLSSALWNIEPSEVADWSNPPADVADQVVGLLGLALNPATLSTSKGAILKRMYGIFRSRFGEPLLCPAEVAAEIGISKRYLHQLVASTGSTFTKLLFEVRLKHAQKMLGNPSYRQLSITQIAMACGFNDAGHFTRLFKKTTGLTPSLFRKKTIDR